MRMIHIAVMMFFCLFEKQAAAQDTLGLPIPPPHPNQLFYLQRTPNPNTVIYDLNMKDGVVDSVNPIHVYWIRYGEKGQQAELSGIQRRYAYGLETKWLKKDQYEIRFLAYKKKALILKKGDDDQFHLNDTINQQEAVLTKVFLQIDGGPVFSPNIKYALLTGYDPATHKIVVEKKMIDK